MSHSHRSDRDGQSFVRTVLVACVSGYQGTTERKGLRKNLIGAFLGFVCSFAAVGLMAGCNTGAAKPNSQTTQTPLISVVITQAAPTMITGNSAVFSAMVSNDPADAGVDWVVTCASPSKCGTFTPNHTASGAPTIYTAPPGIPSKNQVAVSSLSTTDRSKTSTVFVNITSTLTGIAITTPLPGSIPAGAVLQLGATVYGDPANLGVDWTVTCPTPDGRVVCGSGLHSDSGANTPYIVVQTVTDPVTKQILPVVGTSITIMAVATADQSHYATFALPVTAPLSISITQALPTTMLTSATAQVIAVVANDTTNAGVTWSVSCSPGPCGSIVPTQTASGVAATYTAPATVPSPNPAPGMTATITAVANAAINGTNPTIFATVTVNIVAPISVAITQTIKNSAIIVNNTASLIATVSNDYTNAGVDWTVSCGSPGACGTFSPAHTASGAGTMYTASNAIPAGNTVTITATSTADPTKNAQQQNITILSAPPPNSLLRGPFVLYLSARNSQNGPFVLGGVISGDGNGNINSGKFDLADASGNSAIYVLFPLVSPSTYSIGADGRGKITLTLNTGNLTHSFGVPVAGSTTTGTLTLSVVFVNANHALLTETDTFGDASGTLDLQTANLASFSSYTAGLNGTYSLQLTGTENSSGYPGFFVTAAITSQLSFLNYTFTEHTADQSANGVINSVPHAIASQNFNSPYTAGVLTLTAINLGLPRSFTLDLWPIDANHYVVVDFTDQASLLVGGYFTAQPASPSLSGTYAFTEAGATTSAQPQVAGGILTCGSAGSLDVVPFGGTPLTAQPINATCNAPANGRGLIAITGAGSSGISQFAAYPTLDQGLYLIELDGGAAGTSGPSGAGGAYQQTLPTPLSTSALNGNYASNFIASTALGSQGFVGQIISDGVSKISGTVDANSFTTSPTPGTGSPSSGATLNSGSFTAASNGRFPLTFTITPATGQPAPQIPTLNPTCYIVDANTCLLLGLDATAPGRGTLLLQNTGL